MHRRSIPAPHPARRVLFWSMSVCRFIASMPRASMRAFLAPVSAVFPVSSPSFVLSFPPSSFHFLPSSFLGGLVFPAFPVLSPVPRLVPSSISSIVPHGIRLLSLLSVFVSLRSIFLSLPSSFHFPPSSFPVLRPFIFLLFTFQKGVIRG